MSLEKLVNLYHNSFNAKFAVISAGFNGPVAALVNYSYGCSEALMAGGTQAIASFLSTGFTARLVQHFSPIQNRYISYFWGSLVPATATFIISYLGHYFNDTPEPIKSCITPTIVSYTTSYVTNYITRRGHFLPGNYPQKANNEITSGDKL